MMLCVKASKGNNFIKDVSGGDEGCGSRIIMVKIIGRYCEKINIFKIIFRIL
jgi:hypothetical protein